MTRSVTVTAWYSKYMPAIFSKPLDNVIIDDIEELIREQHPETELIEYKEALPSKKPPDEWYKGASLISDYARNQLLAEIIAFANAHGGHLIIGIAESSDHPRRANKITPIPRCADLAEKLKLQIRDCIDPTIPLIGVRAIAVGSESDGVIIVRVPQSRTAPHRLASNKECYVRHSDRCETMTMREIQDLTIQRLHGTTKLDEIFSERRNKFHQLIAKSPLHANGTSGCRISLVPTTELYAPPLYRNRAFLPQLQRFKVELATGAIIEAFIPNSAHDERPIVRGTQICDDANNPHVIQVAHRAGLMELTYRATERVFYDTWIYGVLCNGLLMADAFRCAAGAPDIEYAYELEIAATGATVPVGSSSQYTTANHLLGSSPMSPYLFPRMSLGSLASEIGRHVEIAITDVRNSCGIPFPEKVKLVSWS